MTRARSVRWLMPLVVLVACAISVFVATHGARAAGDNNVTKQVEAASPRAAAALPKGAKVAPAAAIASSLPAVATSSPSAASSAAPTPTDLAPAADAAPSAGAASKEPDLTSLPLGRGLPVFVNIGTFVVELLSFDDVKGEYEATTDLRLRWSDSRLRFAATGSTARYIEYRGKQAKEQLAKLWLPNVDVVNRAETTGYVGHRLRVFEDGQIETIVRTTGRYKIGVDVQNFPFDVQSLKHTVLLREQTADQVMLRFDQDDEEFSRAGAEVALDSWKIGDVDLDSDLAGGWNGDKYSRVTASLIVSRYPGTGMTTIFIPLIASLLIPLLALWMNKATPEGFDIEAFELANMGIGGLFSVIALSYAVSSAYGSIAGSDNTVTRLFALNYATLAISLGIVVLLFRCNFVHRLFGSYVHEQTYRFLLWAVPLLTFGTSIAFVLLAAC